MKYTTKDNRIRVSKNENSDGVYNADILDRIKTRSTYSFSMQTSLLEGDVIKSIRTTCGCIQASLHRVTNEITVYYSPNVIGIGRKSVLIDIQSGAGDYTDKIIVEAYAE